MERDGWGLKVAISNTYDHKVAIFITYDQLTIGSLTLALTNRFP